jgi:hypothetical protein
LASNLDNKTFKVDGAPLASLAKGLSAFCQQTPTAIQPHFFAVLSCELKLKRGHIVGRQVGVGYGEKGEALLDQAIKSDESRRIVYLQRENARLQRLVAELLVKNEQLRQLYEAPSTVAD